MVRRSQKLLPKKILEKGFSMFELGSGLFHFLVFPLTSLRQAGQRKKPPRTADLPDASPVTFAVLGGSGV